MTVGLMMDGFKYALDTTSRKFLCPSCGKRRFVRYVNSQTGEYLPEQFGRCDREDSCRYHRNPYQERYGRDSLTHTDSLTPESFQRDAAKVKPKKVTFIPFESFDKSRTAYEKNNFVKWLLTIFDIETVSRLIARYHIGTSKHWPGSTIFYQIDDGARMRRGKIMLYDETGHRVREPHPHIYSVHAALNIKDQKPDQCLFGLHLLDESGKPIAVVESEKTAIISSAYLPQFIWMATGSKGNLKAEMLTPLKGRKIILFPDIGSYDEWQIKSKGIPGITISNLLEQYAGVQPNGFDLADYLIKYSPEQFKAESEPVKSVPIQKKVSKLNDLKQRDPAIAMIIDTFDCEIVNTDKLELT